MKRLLAVFLLNLLLLTYALANDPLYSPVLKRGSHKGTSIDTDHWRYASAVPEDKVLALQKLTEPFEKEGITYAGFGNLRHKGKWYFAAYPNRAEGASLLEEHFESTFPAAHSFVWVKYTSKAPVVILPEGEGESEKIYDLFISSEAARPKGVNYSLLRGTPVYSDFVLVHGIYSLKEILDTRAKNKDKTIEEFPLKLDPTQSARIVAAGVFMSRRDGYQRAYNTVSLSNCHGASLEMIDKGHGRYSLYRQGRILSDTVGEVYPIFASFALKARGIYNRKLNFFDSNRIGK